jgi:hypothetical protein
MKKFLLIFVLTVFILPTTYSQDDGGASTNEISFGAKAGVNFASFTGDIDGENVDDWEGRTGLNFGGVVNIPISDVFAVQPEVIFSQQGFTESYMGYDVTGRFDYLNIPVLADFTVAEGFSLQAGPQVGFNIKKEIESPDGKEDVEDVESVSFDGVVGAQYRLPIGLFFQARFAFGLSNISSLSEDDVKNSVISISTGWFFN